MSSPHSQSEDLAQLQHIAREFTEGFNTGDVERIMRFYGDTYVDINLRNPVQTHAERRTYYSQVMRRGIHVNVHPDEIQIHGDFAFVRGTIELTRSETSEDLTELRYMEIVRRKADGSWQVMWGMDGPVQEYTPLQQGKHDA